MDRDQFYKAVREYETALNKHTTWLLVGFVSALLVPPLVFFLLPQESRPGTLVILGMWIAILILYGGVNRRIIQRTAVRYGMTCANCSSQLDLRHIGFTNTCRTCGARVYAETNNPMQPTATAAADRGR